MDPYQSPKPDPNLRPNAFIRTCPSCGSVNLRHDDPFRPKPNLLAIILFGWVGILIRTAFSHKTESCRDCGEVRQYRTAANHIALVILVILVGLILVTWFR